MRPCCHANHFPMRHRFHDHGAVSARRALQPDLHLPLHERPLLRRAKPAQQLVKCGRVSSRELEPSQDVERLAQVAAMQQPPGNAGQLVQADPVVAGARAEQDEALVLRQAPTGVQLLDRDQGGAGRFRAAQVRA